MRGERLLRVATVAALTLASPGVAEAAPQTIPVRPRPGHGLIVESQLGGHINYNTEGADENGITNPSNNPDTVGIVVSRGAGLRINTDGQDRNTPTRVIVVNLKDLQRKATDEVNKFTGAGLKVDVEAVDTKGNRLHGNGQNGTYTPGGGYQPNS